MPVPCNSYQQCRTKEASCCEQHACWDTVSCHSALCFLMALIDRDCILQGAAYKLQQQSQAAQPLSSPPATTPLRLNITLPVWATKPIPKAIIPGASLQHLSCRLLHTSQQAHQQTHKAGDRSLNSCLPVYLQAHLSTSMSHNPHHLHTLRPQTMPAASVR